jgi:hypothetical protein
MNIKAIITGSTGMVGEGVLHVYPELERTVLKRVEACGSILSHPEIS